MTDSNQEKDLGVLQKIQRSIINTAATATGMVVTTNCPRCGEVVLMSDRDGECGNHKPVPEKVTAHINFTPSPEPTEPVVRIAREDEPKRIKPNPKYSEKYKTPEADDPIKNRQPAEARARTDGGKSRSDYAGLKGERDPFIQKQLRNFVDYEPGIGTESKEDQLNRLGGEPDVPTYGLDPR